MSRRYGSFPQWHLRHFHGHDNPLAEFPALSHVHESVCTVGHDLAPHVHPDFEICYIHAGKGDWFAEGKTYRLKPGDIYITKPGEVHGGRTDPADPYHIFAVAIDVSKLPIAAYFGSSTVATPKRLAAPRAHEGVQRDLASALQETETFHEGFQALNRRVIPGGEGIEQIFRRILHELDAPAHPDRKSRLLKVMMVQALLVEMLIFVARCCAAQSDKRKPDGPPQFPARPKFQKLIAWVRDRAADPPTLSEMAEYAGLSPAHFVVAFKRETGRTPLEVVTRTRIDEAAVRLGSPKRPTVTDVALDLGFSSPQYFSMVFKKVKGCTPTEWRRKSTGRER